MLHSTTFISFAKIRNSFLSNLPSFSESGLDLQSRILYEDEFLVILNKPSGLLCQPGLGKGNQDSLIQQAQVLWMDSLIVHRLDRDTSGIIVLARNRESHRCLGRQFQERKVQKTYRALVLGKPVESRGTIATRIRKAMHVPPRYCVDSSRGREANTDWSVVTSEQQYSRIELEPLTGRSHQLRVHMDYLGNPILGDPLYGTNESQKAFPRLALHATAISLDHPHTGQRMQWTCSEPF